MSYESRLDFDLQKAENEAAAYQLDSKTWFLYLSIIGALYANNVSADQVMQTSTNISSPQKSYMYMLGAETIDKKAKEINLIKDTIISKLGIDIENHWLPNTGMDKECLFFQCNLDKKILSDVEKYSELEFGMYLAVKGIIDDSKYFDMVAMV